jgi:hypothetical protein
MVVTETDALAHRDWSRDAVRNGVSLWIAVEVLEKVLETERVPLSVALTHQEPMEEKEDETVPVIEGEPSGVPEGEIDRLSVEETESELRAETDVLEEMLGERVKSVVNDACAEALSSTEKVALRLALLGGVFDAETEDESEEDGELMKETVTERLATRDSVPLFVTEVELL